MKSPWLAVGLLSAAAAFGSPESGHDHRPNVLLLIVDTLRADHLGTYGFPLQTSPNIDRLASKGLVFERAISGASSTNSSHASIFASRYTRDHSVGWGDGRTRLTGLTTLPQVFQVSIIIAMCPGDDGFVSAGKFSHSQAKCLPLRTRVQHGVTAIDKLYFILQMIRSR